MRPWGSSDACPVGRTLGHRDFRFRVPHVIAPHVVLVVLVTVTVNTTHRLQNADDVPAE
jgi:hypothetical protein